MERFEITMTSDAFPDPEDAYAIWDNKYDSYHYDVDDRCVTFANEADATAYLEQLRRESTMIRFIDSDRNELFSVPDGSNVTITYFDGTPFTNPCKFIDEHNFMIGSAKFEDLKYALYVETNGATIAPENGTSNTYEIFQIENTRDVDYAFRSFEEAGNSFNRSDYKLTYRGMLSANVTLGQIWDKHNRDSRPFGQKMRSLSMSDVVVFNRDGSKKAFYADRFGFSEVPQFLKQEQMKNRPPKKKNNYER